MQTLRLDNGSKAMNNVIPLRPDPLRNLYELIDTIHDTNPTPEQKRITDEALALVQKMIEVRQASFRQSQWGHEITSIDTPRQSLEFASYGEDDLPAS